MKILYIQYADPGAYPPIQHSARILAESECEILLLGIRSALSGVLDVEPQTQRRLMPHCPPGVAQKCHYAIFCLWVVLTAWRWRANWIYASDLFASPAALALTLFDRWKVLYHEHDSPAELHVGRHRVTRFVRWLLWARKTLAGRVFMCVMPNAQRADRFREETKTSRQIAVVYNCPARAEAEEPNNSSFDVFRLYYHGGIGPELLPTSLIMALRLVPAVTLRIVGLGTLGVEAERRRLYDAASRFGISDRFEFVSAVPRSRLFTYARECSLGWAGMPVRSRNFNFEAMVGASNKVFDYLACGLPVIVPDREDWRKAFVDPGYGLSCNPEDAESIAASIRWFVQHPTECKFMGEEGRRRILKDWNYETQFQPVLHEIVASAAADGGSIK